MGAPFFRGPPQNGGFPFGFLTKPHKTTQKGGSLKEVRHTHQTQAQQKDAPNKNSAQLRRFFQARFVGRLFLARRSSCSRPMSRPRRGASSGRRPRQWRLIRGQGPDAAGCAHPPRAESERRVKEGRLGQLITTQSSSLCLSLSLCFSLSLSEIVEQNVA